MQSQRKKPDSAMPSTITIMPAIKMMVAQLMPAVLSSALPAVYQKPTVKMLLRLRVSVIASMLLIARPKTPARVRMPHANVTWCRSILSITIRMNIAINKMSAKICARFMFLPPS